SDEVASLARCKAKEFWSEPEDTSDATESLFDFWACIGGVAGPPDPDYHGWIDDQLRDRRAGEDRRFYSALLWFRTAPDTALQRAVRDGTILHLFEHDGFRPMLWSGRFVSDWSRLSVDVDSIAQKLPLDDVGTLLLEARRETDLAYWANKLFGKALEL